MMSFAFVSWRVLLFWLNNWGDKSDSSWRDWTFINRISLLFWPWKIKEHVSDGCCRRNILMASSRSLWYIWPGLYILHRCVHATNIPNMSPKSWNRHQHHRYQNSSWKLASQRNKSQSKYRSDQWNNSIMSKIK